MFVVCKVLCLIQIICECVRVGDELYENFFLRCFQWRALFPFLMLCLFYFIRPNPGNQRISYGITNSSYSLIE